MSRVFIGFGQVPYIGQPFTNPIKLSGIAGVQCPLLFQWLSYGASTLTPNINVLVDIGNAACKAMDQIRSVYIDNLGSDNPVYVYFPDTGYTIAAKPNSEGWYPAFTNAKQVWVIGEGFLTGDIPTAFIILCNIPLPASVNTEIDQAVALWKASASITRGSTIYNANLGSPALGDQVVNYVFTFGTPGVFTSGLWGTPYPSGFLYINAIDFYLTGTTGANNNVASTNIIVESTGVAGILFDLAYSFEAESGSGLIRDPGAPRLVGPLSGFNLKLDATQTWQIRVGSIVNNFNSTYNFNSIFTSNPT
jgi:hypothetical protein